jgi:hypothetical protein
VLQGPGVGPVELDEVGDALAVGHLVGDLEEASADVHPHHRDLALGQGDGVTAGPAAHVEHRHAGLQVQNLDEEGDLLLGALGEGVAQVGGPEVVGDVLEPVPRRFVRWRCRRVHAHPFASAQLLPRLRLTSRGTFRLNAPDRASSTTSTV